jgi:hypothetical protein
MTIKHVQMLTPIQVDSNKHELFKFNSKAVKISLSMEVPLPLLMASPHACLGFPRTAVATGMATHRGPFHCLLRRDRTRERLRVPKTCF